MQVLECPARDRPDSMGRHIAPPGVRRQPIAERRLALGELDAVQRRAAKQVVVVFGVDQRELDLLPASLRPLVIGEIDERRRLAAGLPIREAPKPRVADALSCAGTGGSVIPQPTAATRPRA